MHVKQTIYRTSPQFDHNVNNMHDENDLKIDKAVLKGREFKLKENVSFIDLFPDGPVATPTCRILDLPTLKSQSTYFLAQDDLDIFLKIYPTTKKEDRGPKPSPSIHHPSKSPVTDDCHSRMSAGCSLNIENGKIAYKNENLSKFISLDYDCPYISAVVGFWEENLIWEEKDIKRILDNSHTKGELGIASWNSKLSGDKWEKYICWDQLPMDELNTETQESKKKKTYSTQDLLDELEKHKSIKFNTISFRKFNISQDKLYEKSKTATVDRTRQSYGNVSLKHALPAVKLHTKYYKPQLSVRELRRFHRPLIKFPLNEIITFSKLKTNNVNKIKSNSESTEIYKNARQLSLKDTSDFALFEYSEEFPMILSNFGMGCLLYNYYRKKNDNDEPVLNYDLGLPFILESIDASPFSGFGDVFPGTSIQAISNYMYKAPIFRQPINDSHFLLIRHSFCGKTKYFLRTIPYLFTVGQILPLKEVPPPHSRRITQTIKGRMQVSAFRLIKKDPNGLLMYEKFAKIFHDWSELHLKQRLKEFAQFARKGDSRGWWRLKPGVKVPSEDEMRKIVTPEMICLCQSMLVGQQRLRDIGYGDSDEIDEDDSDDLEPKLAPWHLTKNFVQASQNKSMIKVYGQGDPSGRGEAFSLLKASMKEPFLRESENNVDKFGSSKSRFKSYHRFSFAEQQQVYREEIIRVWNSQLESLSRTTPPDDHDLQSPPPTRNQLIEFNPTDNIIDDPNNPASIVGPGGKYLTIRRLYYNPDGSERIESEVITDMSLINVYLRKRSAIEKQEKALFRDTPNITPEEVRSRKRKIIQDQIDLVREKQIIRGHKKRKSGLKHANIGLPETKKHSNSNYKFTVTLNAPSS